VAYIVKLTLTAKKDYKKHIKAGNVKLVKKIRRIIKKELVVDPRNGTGDPEKLKYMDGKIYSRRISDFHRMVYEIEEPGKVRVTNL
jgi:toxin YoeB